jgi:hypothetical protein
MPVEAHSLIGRVQVDVAVSHILHGRYDLGPVRQVARASIKTPHFHQRADRDVESAIAQPAVLLAGRQDPEQLRRHMHRVVGGLPVHFAPFAIRLIVRKHTVQLPGLVESRFHSRFHLLPVVPVDGDRIGRAHGFGALFQAEHLRGGQRMRRRSRQQKQNYHSLFDFRTDFRGRHAFFSPV